jgi:hypothetical protein
MALAITAGLTAGTPVLAALATAPLSRDELAVITNTEAHRAALMAADAKALDTLSAPQLSYGHSDGHVEDKATFIANATSGKTKWLSLAYEDLTARVVGTAAITRFRFVGENQTGDKKSAANLGVLMVWQKQAGVWKLLARQAVKL